IAALDAIPRPAWDLFPIERYIAGQFNHGVVRGRTMPILASRGCPYQCTFCSSPAMWTTKWSARRPDDVLAEMKDYVACYGVNDFAFYDLTAIVRRDWIVAFCELLIAARVAAAGVEAVSIFPFSPYPGTELYDELAAAHRVRLDAAYFQSLVYTDLARMVSYNELFTTAQLRALVLVGNALFLAVQAATH